MVDLEQRNNGILLPIHAQPRARRNGIVGVHNGRLKVAVTQPPEQGKANEAIRRILADALAIKRAQLSLVSGAASNQKKFLVGDLSLDELSRRIAACLPETEQSG